MYVTPETRKYNAKVKAKKTMATTKIDRVNAMSNVKKGQISSIRKKKYFKIRRKKERKKDQTEKQ